MSASPRDRQRARVYRWEDAHVAPCDPAPVAFAQAPGMVRAIWGELGLRFPPEVAALPRRSRCMGEATRLRIRLADPFPSWCLLHEVAHSLTSSHDGHSDGHGAEFMAVYVWLLDRYLRLDPALLRGQAGRAGVAVAAQPRVRFIDSADSMGAPA